MGERKTPGIRQSREHRETEQSMEIEGGAGSLIRTTHSSQECPGLAPRGRVRLGECHGEALPVQLGFTPVLWTPRYAVCDKPLQQDQLTVIRICELVSKHRKTGRDV